MHMATSTTSPVSSQKKIALRSNSSGSSCRSVTRQAVIPLVDSVCASGPTLSASCRAHDDDRSLLLPLKKNECVNERGRSNHTFILAFPTRQKLRWWRHGAWSRQLRVAQSHIYSASTTSCCDCSRF